MTLRGLVRKTLLRVYGVSDESLEQERQALNERIAARKRERERAEEEARRRYIEMRMKR